MTIAGGGYQGTGLVIPHRRRTGEELPSWKERHNRVHKRIRSRVEHVFARMKSWKILRDCRLKGDGVHHAMPGNARLHNLTFTGQRAPEPVSRARTREKITYGTRLNGDQSGDDQRFCHVGAGGPGLRADADAVAHLPEATQAVYRIADSCTNAITPMSAYFVMALGFLQRYRRSAGIGTLASLTLPLSVAMLVAWTLLFYAWWALGIPLGPGAPVR